MRVIATLLNLDLDYFVSWIEKLRRRRNLIFAAAAVVMIILVLIFKPWEYVDRAIELNTAENQLNLAIKNYRNKDYKHAAEWLEKSAAQGNANAQFMLGSFYEEGLGVPQDHKRAFELFRKAAEQGHAYSQFDLGRRYEKGLGVSQDYKQAVEWYSKSAAQGYPKAHLRLGVMYEHGRSVEQNLQTAYMYYYLAYLGGDEDAPENLKTLEAESRLTASQIAKAKEQAQNKFKEFNNK